MELLNTLTRRHRFAYFFLKLRAFNGVLTLEELGSKQAHLVTSKFQTYNLPARASYSRVNTDLVCRVLRSLILSPGVSSADKVQFQQRSYAQEQHLVQYLTFGGRFRGNEWETVARAASLRLIFQNVANFTNLSTTRFICLSCLFQRFRVIFCFESIFC